MSGEIKTSVEKGPEYYDLNLRNVLKLLESSPWLRLYEAAADLMDDLDRGSRLVDLGCGTGRFAKLITSRGFTDYWGVDFSAARVAEARRYNPDLSFEVASIFDEITDGRVRHADICVLLDVLEHIERDIDVIAMIPPGTPIVLSVPNFDSAAHVRRFDDADAVWRRYGGFFEKESARWHEIVNERRPHKRTFILRAIRGSLEGR